VFAAALLASGLYLNAVAGRPAEAPADYRLATLDGKAFTATDFAGGPSILFFGYTHCPDVCPTTLAEIASWYDELGGAARGLKAYFLTVDPERDTPEVLAGYLGWAERVTGLTGPQAEVIKAARAWGVRVAKVPLAGGDYSMDHTASVLLLDRKGELAGSIGYGASRQDALMKLRSLIAS
jgi:protein SCO1/2